MSTSFKIGSTERAGDNARLIIQMGQCCISYVVITGSNECIALHNHHFTAGDSIEKTAEELKQLAADEPVLQDSFIQTTVIYTYPQAILVPVNGSSEELKKEMMELVCGDVSGMVIKTDPVSALSANTVFGIPKQSDSVINYLFDSPDSRHIYSLMPGMYPCTDHTLHCIFSTEAFTVMARKNGQLQAIQTFQYKAPEDAAYHLLNLCEAFAIDINETALHLEGMIDNTSKLYDELYKYFQHMQFGVLPSAFTYPVEVNDYPPHYFSHLFAAALCVL